MIVISTKSSSFNCQRLSADEDVADELSYLSLHEWTRDHGSFVMIDGDSEDWKHKECPRKQQGTGALFSREILSQERLVVQETVLWSRSLPSDNFSTKASMGTNVCPRTSLLRNSDSQESFATKANQRPGCYGLEEQSLRLFEMKDSPLALKLFADLDSCSMLPRRALSELPKRKAFTNINIGSFFRNAWSAGVQPAH